MFDGYARRVLAKKGVALLCGAARSESAVAKPSEKRKAYPLLRRREGRNV